MYLRPFHAIDRPQPIAAKRLVVLLAALILLLPGGILAQEAEVFASQLSVDGYPSPEVPEGPRADDTYFSDAVLIGDSLSVGLDANGVIPEMYFLAKVGLSANSAAKHIIFPKTVGSERKVKLLEVLEPLQPKKIYIWLGTNGVDKVNAETILGDYRNLLNELIGQYPEALIYIMELLPIGEKAEGMYRNFTNDNIDTFNRGLHTLAEEHNVYVLPMNQLLRAPEGGLSREHGTADGIHLRSTGYDLVADFLYTHTIPMPEGGQ